jgi:hypothetical protein
MAHRLLPRSQLDFVHDEWGKLTSLGPTSFNSTLTL